MAKAIKVPTLVDIDNIDRVTRLLRDAHKTARDANCPALARKIASAVKSSEGANRHAWRAYRQAKHAE